MLIQSIIAAKVVVTAKGSDIPTGQAPDLKDFEKEDEESKLAQYERELSEKEHRYEDDGDSPDEVVSMDFSNMMKDKDKENNDPKGNGPETNFHNYLGR